MSEEATPYGESQAPATPDAPPCAVAGTGDEAVRQRVVDILKTCYDPEIPVNIFDLGLIYKIDVDEKSAVNVDMTLTSPMCPVAGTLPPEVEWKIRSVQGVSEATVNVVWEPTWTKDMISAEAKAVLNIS